MPRKNKYIRWWLWSGAGLIFLMLIIGGITRLTGSGLSISDWNLIMGALPPMSDDEWGAAFELYKQFPEYRQINTGMTLAEFKIIFFWEYLHRLLGRATGVVFLIPFSLFWIRGYFDRKLLRRLLLLFGLGALQGAMGWIMVKSGLVDVPHVSHYRLAIHLLLAFILISLCVWFAMDLKNRNWNRRILKGSQIKAASIITGIIFLLQLSWGAFTAGLDAGYIYNTFPLMNGEWLPQNAWALEPALLNLVENPGTVQWVHRILGTLLLGSVFWLLYRTHKAKVHSNLQNKAKLLLLILVFQYLLGIVTLLYHVPISIGVFHQAGALACWVILVAYYHNLKSIELNTY